mmetsp:Transcript_38436/g.100613  ORF Transcript_38436/g.100613 Transcript_38436/m.100613 type:complete len:230 (-) Transcript_38436:105-794(-)
MTSSNNAFTISGVSNSNFLVIKPSSSLRIFTTSIAPGSQPSTSTSLKPTHMPLIMGFTMVTIFSTDPPNKGIIIFSMAPSGLFDSSSSLVLSSESTLGPSKALVIIPLISTCWITRFPLSCRYCRMCPSSRKEFMITSLMVSRMDRNCRGITPLPYKKGMRSNSILTASQLVTPPANPNKPNASTKFHFRNSASSMTRSSTMPSTMITKVTTLLQSPEASHFLGFLGFG